MSNETGPDRIREAIRRDRGGDAPSQPFIVCGHPDPNAMRAGVAPWQQRILDGLAGEQPALPNTVASGTVIRGGKWRRYQLRMVWLRLRHPAALAEARTDTPMTADSLCRWRNRRRYHRTAWRTR